MKVLPDLKIPSPFGSVTLPGLETPPLELPKMPDSNGKKAIGHGLGEDLAGVLGLVPWVGDVIGDIVEDMHNAEISKLLTPNQFNKFQRYNKVFPTALAVVRTVSFKEV